MVYEALWPRLLATRALRLPHQARSRDVRDMCSRPPLLFPEARELGLELRSRRHHHIHGRIVRVGGLDRLVSRPVLRSEKQNSPHTQLLGAPDVFHRVLEHDARRWVGDTGRVEDLLEGLELWLAVRHHILHGEDQLRIEVRRNLELLHHAQGVLLRPVGEDHHLQTGGLELSQRLVGGCAGRQVLVKLAVLGHVIRKRHGVEFAHAAVRVGRQGLLLASHMEHFEARVVLGEVRRAELGGLLDRFEAELIDHELKHRAVQPVVGESIGDRVQRVVDVENKGVDRRCVGGSRAAIFGSPSQGRHTVEGTRLGRERSGGGGQRGL
mmetsp:Transcript_6616/g.16799  ORF Transcript_6616/g.16799 Transcript_6616/m.16799 type:complete len:324 (+) Transcript_6616:95-1066(+)